MKTNQATLDTHLDTLRLPFLKEHCQPLAATAAKNSLPHLGYLAGLIEGEATQRADRAVVRRIQAARFPVIKTLDTFRWDWPKKINRLQIQDLFRLQFIHDHANVILLGTVGQPFDFRFDADTADCFFCSELVRRALPSLPVEARHIYGRHVFVPDQFADLAAARPSRLRPVLYLVGHRGEWGTRSPARLRGDLARYWAAQP